MEIWRLFKRVADWFVRCMDGNWDISHVRMWRDKSTKAEWPLRPGVSPRPQPQACYLFQFSLCPHQHIKLKREQFIRAPRASFKTVAALVCQGSTHLPPPVLLPGDPPWDAKCGTDSVCQGSGKTWGRPREGQLSRYGMIGVE
jgi:hypothetical protein